MNSEKYIGLDVHKATISVAVLDSKGKGVLRELRNDAEIVQYAMLRQVIVS